MESTQNDEIELRIPNWEQCAQKDTEDVDEEYIKGIRFPVRPDINQKIFLWEGDIRQLCVDAIVNSTNESMTDSSGISGSILFAAGPLIQEEISKLEHCRTGEARITRGYQLPTKWVIHTVGPKYNEKYQTASENALHNCYMNSLELLKEFHLRTIAFPVICNQKKGYPSEPGAHIAIRTVRRFLEHWGKDIDKVVFCVSQPIDIALYSRILPLYYPRNRKELLLSKEELPRDIGNEFGETVVEERKIRITAFPGGGVPVPESKEVVIKESLAIVNEALPEEFSMMKINFDEERKKKLDKMSKEEKEKLEQQQNYLNFLYKAQHMDLSDVKRSDVIYESGKDTHGRPVVVIVGNRLPNHREQLERVFLYMIRLMDRITDHTYIVVYVHTNMEDRESPEFSWMKKVYNIIDSKYGDHLNTFYVIHPTFWLKVFEGLISSFLVNDRFFQKVRYVENLDDIYENIDHSQLRLPEIVLRHDIQVNGTRTHTYARRNFAAEEAESLVNDL